MRLKKVGLAVAVTVIEIFLAYWAFRGLVHLCFVQEPARLYNAVWRVCRWPVTGSIFTIPALLLIALVVSLTIIVRKVR